MSKNAEREVLKILAEIQNPDKRVADVAFELFKLGEEKAFERAAGDKSAVHGDDVRKYVKEYMNHVHVQLDKLLDKEYGSK